MHIRARSAFTLIEVLVVIGIIALLTGLLMPALGMARKSSNAVASQSNLKQWGAATINYTNINKGKLPWEGDSDDGGSASTYMEKNLLEKTFWANALSSLLGERTYKDLVAQDAIGLTQIPLPGERSVWVDPGADLSPLAPWQFGTREKFYFNYVPNSRLNDSVATPVGGRDEVVLLHSISDSAATVLMMESRSNERELPGSDVYSRAPLDLCKSDWHAFPNRHFQGGHVVFVDGHVAHILNDVATRSVQGSRDPAQAAGDWNKPGKLIWNPRGVTGDVAP
ncbi:MAG: type II secretion system protein [Planctomycetota bacterium]|nr:type II secretion system protein [Planctomycetota bacterium]